MLNKVLSALVDHGWLDATRPFDKTLYLTHGAAQTLLISRRGRPECFVKFSDRSSLAMEAERCKAASRRFLGLAPRFIGYTRCGSLEVLATRAVVFQAMHPTLMRSSRYTRVVQSGLEAYFRCMRAGVHQGPVARRWLAEYTEYFDRLPWGSAARRALDDLLTALAAVPPQEQHGDFVVNNLGVTERDSLVVFDWEDYGAVDVPGLDLFTLDISLREQMSDAVGGTGLKPAGGDALDLDRLCAAVGLTRSTYEELRPSYAFVFRFLKRNYSPEIRARVDLLLHRLTAASAAVA